MKAPARAPAGAFLGGAAGRLLPASVPLRYFGAAVAFHALAWAALLGGAAQWPGWRGGPGWPLAALHLATLGTLLCSAIGASLQLLPVATQQPLRWPRLAAGLWWLYVPGVALLALGMGLARPEWMAAGGAAVIAGLVVFGLLLALNLAGARGMPGVVLHGWGALGALAVVLVSAAALLALWLGRPLLPAATARALHLAGAGYGLMGLLALGLSYILLPMFLLGPVPPQRRQLESGGCALVALLLAAAAALAGGDGPSLPRALAAGLGGVALWLHLRLMRQVLAGALRRELGPALGLMKLGWAGAAASLALALALALGAPADRLGRAFGVLLVVGWLLSFLLGVLQRILPFLAAMHAARGQRRPPTPSALTWDVALRWHARAHGLALALLLVAALVDRSAAAAAAGAVGLAGALAFALFFATLLRRMARAGGTSPRPP